MENESLDSNSVDIVVKTADLPPPKKNNKDKKTKQKKNKTKQKTKNKEMWCSFCNGPHPSSILAVVTETEARKKKARKRILRLEKRRCFGCLRSGHVSRDCQAK